MIFFFGSFRIFFFLYQQNCLVFSHGISLQLQIFSPFFLLFRLKKVTHSPTSNNLNQIPGLLTQKLFHFYNIETEIKIFFRPVFFANLNVWLSFLSLIISIFNLIFFGFSRRDEKLRKVFCTHQNYLDSAFNAFFFTFFAKQNSNDFLHT